MDTKTLRVRDLMTSEVATLERIDRLSVADDVMRLGRIRHLPVVDQGRLVGVVSQRDLFFNALIKSMGYGEHAHRRTLDEYQVQDAMTESVTTTTPDTPLVEAARLMLDRKIGCLPVLDGDALVGILTEADFVKLVALRG